MKKYFLSILAVALAAGCTNPETETIEPIGNPSAFDTITASCGETRVALDDDHATLLWNNGDEIGAFLNGSTTLHRYSTVADGTATATFTKVSEAAVAEGSGTNYALYPYNENATISDAGVISTTWPAAQTYTAGSFDPDAHFMVAASDDSSFGFKNAGGFLVLKLYGTGVVKSITLRGRNSENLAGAVTITPATTPTVALTGTEKAVTLNCGAAGVAIGTNAETATEFWFSLPPVRFGNGIVIEVTTVDNNVYAKSTANAVDVTRNNITTMAAFNLSAMPADNEIWYTTSDGVAITPSGTIKGENNSDLTCDASVYGVLTFNGDITSIGYTAFNNCSSLESITIPESVTSIDHMAFSGCSRLASITIPVGVTSIGDSAFSGCSSLESIIIPAGVTSIGNGAFDQCSNLASITIPSSITSIGVSAFYDCSSLASITIPAGVTSIGYSAFSGCSSLTSINIPAGVTSINVDTFACCSSLANVTISNGVTSLGDGVFYGCSSLTSITIPNSVTSIDDGVFFGCSKLTTFSGKFASNDNRCLIIDNCLVAFAPSGLTEYTIPEGVTSIRNSLYAGVFEECSSLASITIPEGVESIGNCTFQNCSSLASVYCKSTTVPTGGYKMFDDNAAGRKIYVPTASVADYRAATNWSSYAADIEGYNFE